MPALIFNKIIESLSGSDIKLIGVFCLTMVLYQVLGLFFGVAAKMLTPNPKYWTGGLIVAGTMTNIGDLPIAYVTTLAGGSLFSSTDGTRGTAYSIIFLTVFIFSFFNLGGYRLIQHDFTSRQRDIELNIYDKNQKNEPGIKHLIEVAVARYKKFREKKNPLEGAQAIPMPVAPKEPVKKVVIDTNHNTEIERSQDSLELRHFRSTGSMDDPRISRVPTETLSIEEALSDDQPVSRFHTTGSLSTTLRRYTTASSQRGPFIPGAGSLPSEGLFDDDDEDEDEKAEPLPAPEGMESVINAYSQTQRLQKVLSRQETGHVSEAGDKAAATTAKKKKKGNVVKRTLYRWRLGFLWGFFNNFLRPPSIALILAMTFTMIPWVRRLFYADPNKGNYGIPDAPDGRPALSFVMDITSFVGACEVPLGLATLGATIARLSLKSMPKGFWQTVVALTLGKLVILPIIAVAWTEKMKSLGWIDADNTIAIFVMIISSGVPSATSQVYLTAIYTSPDSDDHEEMDCLAACLIAQYASLIFTMTILLTYTLKKVLEF